MRAHCASSRHWSACGCENGREREDSGSRSCLCASSPQTMQRVPLTKCERSPHSPETSKHEDFTNHVPSTTSDSSQMDILKGYKVSSRYPQNPQALQTTRHDFYPSRLHSTAHFPSSRFLYLWSGWISLVSLYNVWIIIYRYAFDELHRSTIQIWFPLDYTADVFYILDILLGLRTPFLQDGILQRDPQKTRKHYMNSTRFYIDCLCLLPLDFLYLSIGYNSLVRIFRTVKVYRIWDFVYRAERIVRRSSLLHVSKWVLFNLIFIHWNACLYRCIMNAVGVHTTMQAGSNAYSTRQVDELGVSLNDTTSDQCAFANYLHSLFWSLRCMAMFHPLPANGDVSDFIYGYFVIEALIGILLLALLYGKLNNAIGNYDATQNEFQGQLEEFKRFLVDRKAPEALQRKVISWFDYLWRQSRIPDEQKVFSHLPDSLKAEIAIHVHLDTLKRVDIFQDAEEGFLSELVLRLRPALYSPGDYVCRKGQIGRQMFFVTQGKLEVLAADEVNVIATLSAGSYFGEISILNFGSIGNRRTASVRSIGYADLFCLSKEDLWDVLREFPAAKERLEQVGLSRLQDAKTQLQLSSADTDNNTIEDQVTNLQTTAHGSRQKAKISKSSLVGPEDFEGLRAHGRACCICTLPGGSEARKPSLDDGYTLGRPLHRHLSLQCSYGGGLEHLPTCQSDAFFYRQKAERTSQSPEAGAPLYLRRTTVSPPRLGQLPRERLAIRRRRPARDETATHPLLSTAPIPLTALAKQQSICYLSGCHSAGHLSLSAGAPLSSIFLNRCISENVEVQQRTLLLPPSVDVQSMRTGLGPVKDGSVVPDASETVCTEDQEAGMAKAEIPQIRFERAATPSPAQKRSTGSLPVNATIDELPVDVPEADVAKSPDSTSSASSGKQRLRLPFDSLAAQSETTSFSSSSLSLQCGQLSPACHSCELGNQSRVEVNGDHVTHQDAPSAFTRHHSFFANYAQPISEVSQQLLELHKRVASLESDNRCLPCVFYSV